MFCSATSHKDNTERPSATILIQCWQVALRAILSTSTCRIASQLLAELLQRDLIEYSDVSQGVEDMLQNIEFEGPVVVTDSSLYLLRQILEKRKSFAQTSSIQPEDKITQWITSKWRPCKFATYHSDDCFL